MKPLAALTTDELHQKAKRNRLTLGVWIGLCLAWLLTAIVSLFYQGLSWIVGLPLMILPIVLGSFHQLKAIDSELQSR